jgi:predicted membrane chloride channel (bestrophin family)
MKDIHEGQENLIAIHTHRTPISLKAYCLIFIYIFPFIYTPTLINKIGTGSFQTELITYFVVILSEFILISLYNIQDQMEYPFDADGLDDIKIDYFKMYR